jgi:hypothetical protein
MTWDVDKAEAVAAVPDVAAVAARVAWVAPRRPGQAATASSPVSAPKPCYQMNCPKCGTKMTRE